MAGLFESGAIADIVIAVMAMEAIVLIALRARIRHFQLSDVAGMLAAGIFLVLALRAALTGAGWQWIATFLTCAFAAHLLDLRRVLRGRQ
jgi:hypothetical protein